ncbi:MAG: Gfo/Idh/MocA family protein [Candidatus Hodarchaeales archaeon]
MNSSRKITAVLCGAGDRGKDVYGDYALQHPNDIEFLAVAEPNPVRRNEFAKRHDIPSEMCFNSWEELLAKPKIADVAFITTQDQLHAQPALKALEIGYNVLLEKPMATTLEECLLLVRKANEYGLELRVAHVLQYTTFFLAIKDAITSGKLGEVITVDLRENVSYYHYAHSFVRGNWNNLAKSSPMILAKSCHDMDLLYWLVGAPVKYISSFGSLLHFRKENAPSGASERCIGCSAASTCKYYAPRIYLDIVPLLRIATRSKKRRERFIVKLALNHPTLFSRIRKFLPGSRRITEYEGWPVSVISDDLSQEGKLNALKTTDYGRCVYMSDNDVVDHQVVNFEFENGVTSTFTMHGFSHEEGRTIRIDGTIGTIIGEFLSIGSKLTLYNHLTGIETDLINIKADTDPESGHGGGDRGLMDSFIKFLQTGEKIGSLTNASASLESHILAFAAEESRLKKKVICMEEMRA